MFGRRVISDAMTHARQSAPRESCGLVVDGEYLPRNNTAANPIHDFRIAPQAWIGAERRGVIQGVIHSHPDGPAHPSHADMAQQIATGLPWGIVSIENNVVQEPFFWGGTTPIPDLEGRPFRHGVTDCYALVRDYYRLKLGVDIPDYPREASWWDGDDDLLMDNFRSAGFEPVEDMPRPGDGVLLQISSNRVNHCGVLIENGLLLHHLGNRLSRSDPFNRWRKYVHLIVRRPA